RVIDISNENVKDWSNNPDSMLSNTIYKLKNSAEKKINDLIYFQRLTEKRLTEFATKSKLLGKIPNEKITIRLKDNTQIISKPYTFPYKIYQAVDEEIKTLLKNNIIKKNNSEFCSPAFPIKKKNGKVRLVVDYRKLNS